MGQHDLEQAQDARKPRGFLKRLLHDRAGNALMIMGMAMIPITAMVGSGVDVSRAYLAKSRLQQACDAGALAIRRSMTGNTLTAADIAEGRRFFDFNFPNSATTSTYELTNFTFAASRVGTTNAVQITTTGTLPNKVMQLFGINNQFMSVTCNASQDFVNTDIVFVLDTTGSMAQTTSDGVVKLTGLKNAVLAFYDQMKPAQDALETRGLRLRYAFVPYSSTVNVGKLLLSQNCASLRDTGTFSASCTLVSTSSKYRTKDSTSSTYYQTIPHTNLWLNSSSYTGCIEERKTVNVGTGTSMTIDPLAFDLDVDMLPTVTNPDTQWVPWDPAPGLLNGSSNRPYGANASYTACPAEARRLAAWTRADLSTYLNTLVAIGGTYHDVGMIWGARMISSAGVFGDSPDTYNGIPNKRFMIFLTDGQLAPDSSIYGLYGVEAYDKRIGGSVDGAGGTTLNSTALFNSHQHRFDMMCNKVKSMKVSIWMVVFDDTLSTSMKNCADNLDQASTSSDSSGLSENFQQIAKNIGTLRLTQ